MSRLPINPALDRSANTRRGLRLALAVGLGTLALGVAAGAVAAGAHQAGRVARVSHIDSAKATAPSTLRGGDLFSNPAAESEAAAALVDPAAPVAQASTPSIVAAKVGAPSIEHKKGGAPPTQDPAPSVGSAGGSPAKPKPQPTAEPSPSPAPTPSPGD